MSARLYKHDLDRVAQVQEEVGLGIARAEDVYAARISIDLWSKNDYRIGELVYEEEQWSFIPHFDGSATQD